MTVHNDHANELSLKTQLLLVCSKYPLQEQLDALHSLSKELKKINRAKIYNEVKASKKKVKKIIVRYSKLARTKAWGWAHHWNNSIEIDVRAKGKKHLEILNHEAFHLLFPELDEDEIEKKSIVLTNVLWSEGYRRVDNDNAQPLQDNSL